MAWANSDCLEFSRLLRAYWPTLKESEEELEALIKLYLKHLERFRPTAVFDALGVLKTQGKRFLPEITEIDAECRKTADTTDRGGLIERLKYLAREGARWTSPKGRDCLITTAGLSFCREDGERATLPWGSMSVADFRVILKDNERDVRRSELVGWQEFCNSPAAEEVCRRIEAKGEDASWARMAIEKGKRGGKPELYEPCPF